MTKIIIGKYEGTVYPEGDGYTGAIDIGCDGAGNRKRVKRKGRTKTDVKNKLKKLVDEREKGIKTGKDADSYTVADAVADWLKSGTRNLSPGTVSGYRVTADKHLVPAIGMTRLKRLSAGDVDTWLDGLTGELSSRSLQSIHSTLRRSIRHAQARDLVERNVADLVSTPKGKTGRPSKALTLKQARAVIQQSKSSPLHAYVVLTIMTGVRTEEARALRWDHVVAWNDKAEAWQPVTSAGFGHERYAVYVWRSVRVDGDTKTEQSRRTLEVPAEAVAALKALHRRQATQRLKAGPRWQDTGLVFTTRTGTELSAGYVRRTFADIAKDAKVGDDWVPRETRHTFVSIMSDNAVPIEVIADLVGHKNHTITGRVYRKQLKPVITTGATTMNAIFSTKPATKTRSRKAAKSA